jgi:hypothetical protein
LDRNEENRNELPKQKKLIEDLNIQLSEEIITFKINRENDILMIVNKFFKEKWDLNNGVSKIFDLHNNK